MGYFKHSNTDKPSVPPSIERLLHELYQEFSLLGLIPEMAEQEFQSAVLSHMEEDELLDLVEAWEDGYKEPARCDVLGRSFGIHQDWRFDPAYVLARVNQCLVRFGIKLSQQILGTEMSKRDGRNWRISTCRLVLNEDVAVEWRFTLLPGLMEGINRLLCLKGLRERFMGLRTSGDYYVYILADPESKEKIRGSELLELQEDSDPTAGPVHSVAKN